MTRNVILDRHHAILDRISRLPKKMLSLTNHENVTDFVLHELCHQDCFNFEKAAYFVDNPDFDCFKGVTGISRTENFPVADDIWKNPHGFSAHMQTSSFNQRVRSMIKPSMRRNYTSDEMIVKNVAEELVLQNPRFYSWDTKHDNHGLLIYEKACATDHCDMQDVLDGLCLLSFCPIF
jgi:hypothetical protein